MAEKGRANEGRQDLIPVAERFISINGEGQYAGKLAAFIRVAGCNLNCSYCDTQWANEPDCAVEWCSVEELAGWASTVPAEHITLTGGEPLLQPLATELISALMQTGRKVEVETNGSVGLLMPALLRQGLPEQQARNLSFTVDYKLPDSGMEADMLTGNFEMLQPQDVVKFVAGSHDDLFKMQQVVLLNGLCDKCQVFVSPVFGKLDPADIVQFLQEMGLIKVRAQLQLHKIIWPDTEKGV